MEKEERELGCAVIFQSLTIIISIWNMSAFQSFDFLELCPHLRSEWTPLISDHGYLYHHTYSSDISEVKYLTSVSMKELDTYSNR